jgi:hypothetical protein
LSYLRSHPDAVSIVSLSYYLGSPGPCLESQ